MRSERVAVRGSGLAWYWSTVQGYPVSMASQVARSTTPVGLRPARRWKFVTAETKAASTLASLVACHRPRRCCTMRTLTPFMPHVRVLVWSPSPVMWSVGWR